MSGPEEFVNDVMPESFPPQGAKVIEGKAVNDGDQRTPAEYLATLTDLQREALKAIQFKNEGVEQPLEQVPTAVLKEIVANLELHGAPNSENDAKLRATIKRRTLKALKDRMMILGLPMHLTLDEMENVVGASIIEGLVEAGVLQTHGTLLAERRIRTFYQQALVVADADGVVQPTSSKESGGIAIAKDMKEATKVAKEPISASNDGRA